MSKTQVSPKVIAKKIRFWDRQANLCSENQKSLLFIAGAIVAMVHHLRRLPEILPIGSARSCRLQTKCMLHRISWSKKDWDKAIKGDASYPGFEKDHQRVQQYKSR